MGGNPKYTHKSCEPFTEKKRNEVLVERERLVMKTLVTTCTLRSCSISPVSRINNYYYTNKNGRIINIISQPPHFFHSKPLSIFSSPIRPPSPLLAMAMASSSSSSTQSPSQVYLHPLSLNSRVSFF